MRSADARTVFSIWHRVNKKRAFAFLSFYWRESPALWSETLVGLDAL